MMSKHRSTARDTTRDTTCVGDGKLISMKAIVYRLCIVTIIYHTSATYVAQNRNSCMIWGMIYTYTDKSRLRLNLI